MQGAGYEAVVSPPRMGRNEAKKRGQSPFLYFDYYGTEKSKKWKKGDCPLFLLPKGQKCRLKKLKT